MSIAGHSRHSRIYGICIPTCTVYQDRRRTNNEEDAGKMDRNDREMTELIARSQYF